MKANSKILGNETVLDSLSASLKSGGLSQAVLIEGPKGSGKFTLSLELAMAILCTGDGEKPCLTCNSCKKIQNDIHPDVTIIDKHGKEITVATARELRTDCFTLPNDSDRKVYIIRDAENLNTNASNALLKILEEPPSHVNFILTCKGSKSVLPTILSRCSTYLMSPIEDGLVFRALKQIFPETDEAEIKKAVRFSSGVVGRGISFFEKNSYDEQIINIVTAIKERNELLLFEQTTTLEKLSREEFLEFLVSFQKLVRDSLLISQNIPLIAISPLSEYASEFAFLISDNALLSLYELCNECADKCNKNVNMSMLCASFCTKCFIID